MTLINSLWSEKDKTAKKKKVTDTLGPIKDEYDKFKDIRKRGEDSDAYQ